MGDCEKPKVGCLSCKHQGPTVGKGVYSKMCNAPQLVDHIDPKTGWTGGPMLPSAACREVKSLCSSEAKWHKPVGKV
jgi:hypothetical protein